MRLASHFAGDGRGAFLVFAVVLGPIGMVALHVASQSGIVIPRPGLGGWALVNALLLAPTVEEIVFRGGLQEALDRTDVGGRLRCGGLSIGNVVTSAVFSAAHLITAPPWLAIGTFFPSLVFGRLKQLYPSLLPAVLVHGWYNACYLAAAGW